ncbi:MAG: fibronectin type III domain-containing protein [Caldilineaceae bacterium]
MSHTTHTSETFLGQDGKTYEYRARAVDRAHNVEAFPNNAQAATTVDTLPPTVTIQQLPAFTGGNAIQLRWSGTDSASGIRAYDLQFRFVDQGWNDLLVNSSQTAYTFNGANGQQLEFRVSAIDNANHASAWDAPGTLTRTTIDSVTPLACIVLIQADGANSYLVEWASDDGNGSGVRAYDVRYRFNNGDWQTWQQQVGFTSARFTPTQGNGTYHFTVRAIDNANNQGNYQDKFGSILRVGPSTTITDTNVLYLPIMRHQHICQL